MAKTLLESRIHQARTQDQSRTALLAPVLPPNFPQNHFLPLESEAREYLVRETLRSLSPENLRLQSRRSLTGSLEVAMERQEEVDSRIDRIRPDSLRRSFLEYLQEIVLLDEPLRKPVLAASLAVLDETFLEGDKNAVPPDAPGLQDFREERNRALILLRERMQRQREIFPEIGDPLAERIVAFAAKMAESHSKLPDGSFHKVSAQDRRQRRERILPALESALALAAPNPRTAIDRLQGFSPEILQTLNAAQQGKRPESTVPEFRKLPQATALLVSDSTLYLSQEAQSLDDPKIKARKHLFDGVYGNLPRMREALTRETHAWVIPACRKLQFGENFHAPAATDTPDYMLARDLQLGDQGPLKGIPHKVLYAAWSAEREAVYACDSEGQEIGAQEIETLNLQPQPGCPLLVLPLESQLSTDPGTNRMLLTDPESPRNTVLAQQAVRSLAVSLCGAVSVVRHERDPGNREIRGWTPIHDYKPTRRTGAQVQDDGTLLEGVSGQWSRGALDGAAVACMDLASHLGVPVRVHPGVGRLARDRDSYREWKPSETAQAQSYMATQQEIQSGMQYLQDRMRILQDVQNENRLQSSLGHPVTKEPGNTARARDTFLVRAAAPLKTWMQEGDSGIARVGAFLRDQTALQAELRAHHGFPESPDGDRIRSVLLVPESEDPTQELHQTMKNPEKRKILFPEGMPRSWNELDGQIGFRDSVHADHEKPDLLVVAPDTSRETRFLLEDASDRGILTVWWGESLQQRLQQASVGPDLALFAATPDQRDALAEKENFNTRSVRKSETVHPEVLDLLPDSIPVYAPAPEILVLDRESEKETLQKIAQDVAHARRDPNYLFPAPIRQMSRNGQNGTGKKLESSKSHMVVADLNAAPVRVLTEQGPSQIQSHAQTQYAR